jgi:hypothetical protein
MSKFLLAMSPSVLVWAATIVMDINRAALGLTEMQSFGIALLAFTSAAMVSLFLSVRLGA